MIKSKLKKVLIHYQALKEYKEEIEKIDFDYSIKEFNKLDVYQKALLEAYLKRFASLQDYLGSKVFSALLDMAGISYTKMSEVLSLVEKEGIIDLDKWISFRNMRNNLEHDYLDELSGALLDLKFCIDSFVDLQDIVFKVFEFAKGYDESIELLAKKL